MHDTAISPYEITLVKVPDTKMAGFCQVCLFYEPEEVRSEDMRLQCALLNHKIKFNSTAGEGIMMCMPLVYTLIHRVTGKALNLFQVGMLYSEHKIQHNEFPTTKD